MKSFFLWMVEPLLATVMACMCQIPYEFFFGLVSVQFAKASLPTVFYIAGSEKNSNTLVRIESSCIDRSSIWCQYTLTCLGRGLVQLSESDRLYRNRQLFTYSVRCNISKTSASVSSGVPNTEKQMKARGRRPSAFIVSRCLEPLMKHETRVFGIASYTSCRLLLFVNNSYRMW